MIKTVYRLIFSVTAVIALVSCNSDEDLTSRFKDPTPNFLPADTATDAISQLRRDFYEKNGSFLLFNDTLQHEYLGKDINGDDRYFTELVDINYYTTQTLTASEHYVYKALRTDELKKSATDYLERFIIPHFGKNLYPFSFLLTGTITCLENNSNKYKSSPFAVSGQRCIALACSQLPSLRTDNQKKMLANRHLLVIVGRVASNNSSKFSAFTDICSGYYNRDLLNIPDGYDMTSYLRSLGFLGAGKSKVSYPSQSEDFDAYTSLAISYTEENVKKIYGDYPLVLKRYYLFKEALSSLGFIYDIN